MGSGKCMRSGKWEVGSGKEGVNRVKSESPTPQEIK